MKFATIRDTITLIKTIARGHYFVLLVEPERATRKFTGRVTIQWKRAGLFLKLPKKQTLEMLKSTTRYLRDQQL